MGVKAPKCRAVGAELICGSLWQGGSCIFGVMEWTGELLTLGDNCRASAQKFGGRLILSMTRAFAHDTRLRAFWSGGWDFQRASAQRPRAGAMPAQRRLLFAAARTFGTYV